MFENTNTSGFLSNRFIKICYVYAIFLTILIWLLNSENPKGFAIISLAIGLFFLWGVCCGFVMYKLKLPFKRYYETHEISPFVVVSIGGIFLALVEEAIATLMTNMAPLFGFSTDEVFITASSNYIEVVTRHSVIVFVPWFIAWAFILQKYSIRPNLVLILFGITGLLAESLTFGLQNLLQFGFWIIIYGLMIYLPAFVVYNPEKGIKIKQKLYPLLVVIPFLALLVWAGIFILLGTIFL